MCKKKDIPVFLNHKEKAIIDGSNGDVYRPACWEDLAQYVGYLEGNGRHDKAQKMLRKVLRGEKVITNMIEASQRAGLGYDHQQD